MSNLKLSNKLFLGKEELNHLKKSIKEDGYLAYIKHDIQGYGIGYTIHDTNQDSFKVISGSAGGALSIQAGYAIDRSLNIMQNRSLDIDRLTIPADSSTYYILLSNATDTIEEGTLSIDASGVLTGVGTLFSEMLRGMPDFSSKISFPGSLLNTGEYRVASVTSNISAQLNVTSNSMSAESGVKYRIVGTFNRSHVPATADKYPFERNGYTVSVSTTDSSDGENVFVLGTAVYDGTSLSIIDQRNRNILTTGSGETGELTQVNPLVGLEQVTYSGDKSSFHRNLMKVGWGFRSINTQWTFDSINQEVIINSGAGGSWISTAPFTTGDWDGWYLWAKDDGVFLRINSSTKVGSNINLNIEYTPSLIATGEIAIVPSCHEVEFLITNTLSPAGIKTAAYPVHQGEAQIEVEAGIAHKVYWRHIKGMNSTKWTPLNTGVFLRESQFDEMGVQTGSSYSTSVAGAFTAILNPLNHEDDKASRTLLNNFAGTNRFLSTLQLASDRLVVSSSGTFSNSNIFNNKNRLIIEVAVSGEIGYSGFSSNVQGGSVIVIENDKVNSIGNIVLLHEDSSSVVGSRISLPNNRDLMIAPGEMATLIMDETGSPDSRWHLHSTSAKSRWKSGSTAIGAGDIFYSNTPAGISFNNGAYRSRKDGDTVTVAVEINIGYFGGTTVSSPEVAWILSPAALADIGPSASNFSIIPGSAAIYFDNGGSFANAKKADAYMESNVMVIKPDENTSIPSGSIVLYMATLTYQID